MSNSVMMGIDRVTGIPYVTELEDSDAWNNQAGVDLMSRTMIAIVEAGFGRNRCH